MLYTTDQTNLLGRDGKRHSLLGPLVRAPGKPEGGWKVNVEVKGQQIMVPGHSPIQVYNNASTLLKRNNVAVRPVDLWTSLNAQWLSRMTEKHHLVSLTDLLHVSRAAVAAGAPDKRKRSYKPSDWGAIAWNWLNLFLARDSYNFREFLLQCNYVLDCLNPATNDALGCADCYREWAQHVEQLKKNPGMNQQAAREWLWRTHNSVSSRISKQQLSWEVAAKKAFWI